MPSAVPNSRPRAPRGQANISSGDSILDQAGGFLVLLGAPGSGKTITLLALARRQLRRALRHGDAVPVMLNLSQWSPAYPTVSDWVASELAIRYRIPRHISIAWLRDQQISLFLDGLDELSPVHRRACIEQLNEFLGSMGAPGLVVSSRLSEYQHSGVRLNLNVAVRLLPASDDEVRRYLSSFGPVTLSISGLVRRDRRVAALARNPFMLNAMVLAAVSGTDLDSGGGWDISKFRRYLIDTHVRLGIRKAANGMGEEATQRLLEHVSWLAARMKDHGMTVFRLQDLQPTWLSTPSSRYSYLRWTRDFPTAILSGVIVIALFCVPNGGRGLWSIAGVAMMFGIMALGLPLRWFRSARQGRDEADAPPRVKWVAVGDRYLAGDILTVEVVHWQTGAALRGGLGLAALCSFSWLLWFPLIYYGSEPMLLEIVIAMFSNHTIPPLPMKVWLFGILVVAPATFLGGFVHSGIKRYKVINRTRPNQGIRMSAANAVVTGLISAIVGYGLWLVIGATLFGTRAITLAWLLGGSGLVLAVSLLGAAWLGGNAVLRHYVLRVILARHHAWPFSCVNVLELASRGALLHRVGGGYAFLHGMLRDHLAAGYREPVPAD